MNSATVFPMQVVNKSLKTRQSMMLSEQRIEANREEIINLLSSTHREGIEQLLRFLSLHHFYETPSSVSHHHNWRGGLAQHALGVYHKAVRMNGGHTSAGLILAALLHDICKVLQFYVNEKGLPAQTRRKVTGHGRLSLSILNQLGLQLYPAERRAIRWHMGGHHARFHELAEVQLTRTERLYQLVHEADKKDARFHRAA